ncbi:helix-turn-helix transcriptional regulator [Streptomyces hundungensis]
MDAGLTGRELSARCGWHPAKTTRLQKGKAPPTDADIRAWCRACEADDQAEDLIAIARAVDAMYVEWRKLHHSGMRRAQAKLIKQYSETAVTRAYVSNVMPGFFQTTAYAAALMQSITDFQGTPDDVTEAVAARVSRSRFLYEGGHQFIVLMEESVLRFRIGDARTMAGQLQHLLVVMALPSVTLGVIPFGVRRTIWPLEAFYLHDNRRAAVETLTAKINVVKPRELGDYAKAFVELSRLAVYGDSARSLIERAINAL